MVSPRSRALSLSLCLLLPQEATVLDSASEAKLVAFAESKVSAKLTVKQVCLVLCKLPIASCQLAVSPSSSPPALLLSEASQAEAVA